MMMQERKINIMGISETRRKTPGRTVVHDNYIGMARGDPTGKYGVAIIVTPEVANMIGDFKPINNRMAHATVNFGREKAIFMIVYAPQQGRTDEKRRNYLEMYRQRSMTSKATEKL